MKPRKYRAKTAPALLGVINDIQQYTKSEWVYGYYAPTYLAEINGEIKNTYCIIGDDVVGAPEMLGCGHYTGLPRAYNIMEDTVSQSIGLFDRNGIEIFEGDIFQYNDEYLVLFYENGEYKFRVYGWYYTIENHIPSKDKFGEMRTEPIQDYILNNMEVIGNIWDNPNLIEEPKVEEYE